MDREYQRVESRQLIAFATKQNPEELYHAAGSPHPDYVHWGIPDHIKELAKEGGFITAASNIHAVRVVGLAIEDIQKMTTGYLLKPQTHEARIKFLEDKETIRGIARVAIHKEKIYEGFRDQIESNGENDAAPQTHLFLPPEALTTVTSALEGCPFAHHDTYENIHPLFRKIVPWTGRVVLESLRHHGQLKPW